MKSSLLFLLVSLCLGCASDSDPRSNKETNEKPKTHFGKAISEAHHIGKAQESRDQSLKEQADSL